MTRRARRATKRQDAPLPARVEWASTTPGWRSARGVVDDDRVARKGQRRKVGGVSAGAARGAPSPRGGPTCSQTWPARCASAARAGGAYSPRHGGGQPRGQLARPALDAAELGTRRGPRVERRPGWRPVLDVGAIAGPGAGPGGEPRVEDLLDSAREVARRLSATRWRRSTSARPSAVGASPHSAARIRPPCWRRSTRRCRSSSRPRPARPAPRRHLGPPPRAPTPSHRARRVERAVLDDLVTAPSSTSATASATPDPLVGSNGDAHGARVSRRVPGGSVVVLHRHVDGERLDTRWPRRTRSASSSSAAAVGAGGGVRADRAPGSQDSRRHRAPAGLAPGRQVRERPHARRRARIEEHGLHVWFGFYDNAFG